MLAAKKGLFPHRERPERREKRRIMKQNSVKFCTAAVWLCLGLIAVLCVSAPRLLKLYMAFRALQFDIYTIILIAFYLCCVPAVIALISLLRILGNIRKQQMFCTANSHLLRIVSWCCLAVAALCLWAGFWYFPLFFVTAAMLFLFVTVRVVCSLMDAGIALAEENSLTI